MDALLIYGFIFLLTVGMHYTWPVDYKGQHKMK